MPDPETHQQACRDLAAEAERIQPQLNELIAHAALIPVTLKVVLHEANAELLTLPDELRRLAARSASYNALHRGMQAGHQTPVQAPGDRRGASC